MVLKQRTPTSLKRVKIQTQIIRHPATVYCERMWQAFSHMFWNPCNKRSSFITFISGQCLPYDDTCWQFPRLQQLTVALRLRTTSVRVGFEVNYPVGETVKLKPRKLMSLYSRGFQRINITPPAGLNPDWVFYAFYWPTFLILKKRKIRLMRSPCCLYVHVFPSSQLSHAWASLYETWYVYYGTWAHLNGVLHKSLPSVCLYLYSPFRC
jgi:hypothetical protein